LKIDTSNNHMHSNIVGISQLASIGSTNYSIVTFGKMKPYSFSYQFGQ
jgi:hypothetical protein